MKMGEVGAAIAGGIVGGAIVAGPAWQAGYDQCYSKLQPVIQRQAIEIAELRRQLEDAKKTAPVLASVKRVFKL